MGMYGHIVPGKIVGQLLMVVLSTLIALAKQPSDYWPFIFPGMIVGMIGLAMAYVARIPRPRRVPGIVKNACSMPF